MADLNPIALPAADIIRWIEAKNPQAIDHWAELGTDEYARAFTAARTAGADVIDDLYFSLADTIAQGGTERDYAAMVVPILKQKGWLGGDDREIARRVALIYDMNLRFARASGLWDRVQRNKVVTPYLRGVTARDRRVRHPPKSHDDHRAFDGIVLPVDHPFWLRWWPPFGFRCRCSIIPMTRSQFARLANGETSAGELAEREARLGTNPFVSPGAGVYAQLVSMADHENSGPRMLGLPPVNVAQERATASAVFSSIAAGALADALIGLIGG